MKQMLCGAAESVITPRLGLSIPGYFGARKATGVKSELMAQAIALDNGDRAVILISIEILDFQASFSTAVRKRISEKTGVPPHSIMIAATHIHTGQPTNYTGFSVKKNTPAMNRLADIVVDTAIQAFEGRKAVHVGFGSGTESRISFNRNFRMADGSIMTNPGKYRPHDILEPLAAADPSVAVLRFDEPNGKTVAQIVNFACHPDTVGGSEYCADYPGEMRKLLKEHFGNDSVILFFNGCAGNINHIDAFRYLEPNFSYPQDHYKAMGAMLAQTVLSIHRQIVPTKNTALACASKIYRAKRRQPTEEMVAWAEEIQKQEVPNRKDLVYSQELLSLHRHPLQYATVEIQAMNIAGCSLVGLPCEAYTETGLSIKDRSPFENNMVASLANGTVGYLVTEPAFSAGVYESKLSRYNSFLSPSDAHRMVEVAVNLLCRLSRS